jgi:predicted dehydrogenase
LVAACDRETDRLAHVLRPYPDVEAVASYEELLQCDIDAVAIATPVRTHGPMAIAALQAGKHVLVEKPMADSVEDAEEMVRLADDNGLTLAVDHTFVYSTPVRMMKEIIHDPAFGDLYYVDGVRINLGLFQHDVNVAWDLAVHDLSILDYLIERTPTSVSAFGTCHTGERDGVEDVAYLNLDFGEGLIASFHVNWLSPVKVRHFIVGGSRKSIVYNDLKGDEKLKVYDSGIDVSLDAAARHQMLISYRTGDVWSPHVAKSEPLANLVSHFAACIRDGQRPITDGEAGLRVVRILEAGQRSIRAQGGRVVL